MVIHCCARRTCSTKLILGRRACLCLYLKSIRGFLYLLLYKRGMLLLLPSLRYLHSISYLFCSVFKSFQHIVPQVFPFTFILRTPMEVTELDQLVSGIRYNTLPPAPIQYHHHEEAWEELELDFVPTTSTKWFAG